MTKVMIFTPTWEKADGELAMWPDTRESVEAQRFDGEIEWVVSTHNPFPGETHRNVLAQYVRGRALFLESDCDAFLTVEHDMVLPVDAVQKLVAAKDPATGRRADVAYGIYLLRHGSLVLNAWEYVGNRNLGESLTLMPAKLAAARKQGTVRVCGCGFGCTLIWRDVMERLEMHGGGEGDLTQICPDIPFAVDCLQAGLVAVARFDVVCDHLEGHRRLRPFHEPGSDMVKVRALQDVIVMTGHGGLAMKPGELYEVQHQVANDLMRAGYVEIVPVPKLLPEDDVTEAAAFDGAPERAVLRTVRRKGREL